MNITNITVTKTAEEKTENASYVLEYSIVNDELNRLHVSVNEKEADTEGNIPPSGLSTWNRGTSPVIFPLEGNWVPYSGISTRCSNISVKVSILKKNHNGTECQGPPLPADLPAGTWQL
ncbi:hypothetical protein NIB75_18815 [Bacteroides uniformis]|jgi:hypothetical protein|nr:hypothetical protein [Bacteroides uniformis]